MPERNPDSFISGTTAIMRGTLAAKMTLILLNQARLTRDFSVLLNPSWKSRTMVYATDIIKQLI